MRAAVDVQDVARDRRGVGLLRQHLPDGELGDVQEALEIRRNEAPVTMAVLRGPLMVVYLQMV
jgi:hypothetical protein